jgi:Ca2+-binding EF-hand superfamily protein
MQSSIKLPSLVDDKTALEIAGQLFDRYDRNRSSYLEENEIALMMEDVPRILNQTAEDITINDLRDYAKVLDVNGDGKVCRKDIEKIVLKYLL